MHGNALLHEPGDGPGGAPLRAPTPARFHLLPGIPPPPDAVRAGPRTGLAQAADRPWRFWIADDPTVSPYRRHTPPPLTRIRPLDGCENPWRGPVPSYQDPGFSRPRLPTRGGTEGDQNP